MQDKPCECFVPLHLQGGYADAMSRALQESYETVTSKTQEKVLTGPNCA